MNPPEVCTEKNKAIWSKYNMRPVFLPFVPSEDTGQIEANQDRFVDFLVKPRKWFYQMIEDGEIERISSRVRFGWYLVDFSVGVDYQYGTQVFPNDPLAPIIEKLRKAHKIGTENGVPLGSRFAITKKEWIDFLLPALGSELNINSGQLRLERYVEFNAIGNLYDSNRGQFNMWELFQDNFGRWCSLCGGHRGDGGLANVHVSNSMERHNFIAARPIAVL